MGTKTDYPLKGQGGGLGQGKTFHIDVLVCVAGTAFLNDHILIRIGSVLIVMEKSESSDAGFLGQLQGVRVSRVPPTLRYGIFFLSVFRIVNE